MILWIMLIVYLGLSIYGVRTAIVIPRLSLGKETPATVGLKFVEVNFPGRVDRVNLKGWYLPGQSDSVIIIVQGGFQNRVDQNIDTFGLSRDLVQSGWNVLLFDLRGRGESEGKGLSLSNIERDIGGAVDYLRNSGYSDKDIFIIGFSTGAVSACIFASHNHLGGLVLDGCCANVHRMAMRQAKLSGIPEFLVYGFMPGVLLMARLIYGYEEINPIDVVSKVKCPIFFIHEENDALITWKETQLLYQASRNPANLIWQVKSAAHSQSYRSQPSDYINRVSNFFLSLVQ